MSFVFHRSAAALILTGAVTLASVPAFAGADEAQRDSFWTRQGQTSAGNQAIMKMDPRDAKAAEGTGQSADAANPYFDHAEGTMSTNAGTAAKSPTDNNGQYVAAYHQYMQVDPRDAKVDPNAGGNVDGGNIYFNHAQGTMSGN